jgi:hypothetical protein
LVLEGDRHIEPLRGGQLFAAHFGPRRNVAWSRYDRECSFYACHDGTCSNERDLQSPRPRRTGVEPSAEESRSGPLGLVAVHLDAGLRVATSLDPAGHADRPVEEDDIAVARLVDHERQYDFGVRRNFLDRRNGGRRRARTRSRGWLPSPLPDGDSSADRTDGDEGERPGAQAASAGRRVRRPGGHRVRSYGFGWGRRIIEVGLDRSNELLKVRLERRCQCIEPVKRLKEVLKRLSVGHVFEFQRDDRHPQPHSPLEFPFHLRRRVGTRRVDQHYDARALDRVHDLLGPVCSRDHVTRRVPDPNRLGL